MIHPIETLTFSMQSKPGLYAVLIGSGVSRSLSEDSFLETKTATQ